uniref:Transposon protein putative n=1 Tax=Albugo laibachii Nc14 TaxID=890382 RepID=F0X2E5_9STRA|nr:transposon protein putative [Albugo laibachii Nc14]|eukprot:CCA28033.1 transposon protein putative [Albugo laibachii Nc14]
MFLAAVAHPRCEPFSLPSFDFHRKCIFDGKVGLWPFVEKYVAKRNSKNRQKGTILTVNREVVNRDVYPQLLIDCVIPAIKMKWPARDRHNTIYIQQDNAKPHVFPDDEAVVSAGQSDGRDIRLRFQPPNSPDCNVLDLGYFRAIRSLQYEQEIYGTDDLIAAFSTMSVKKLNHVFPSLPSVLECIIGEFEDNGYKLPHTAIGKLERQGKLPLSITFDSTVYHSAVAFLALSTRT